MLTGERGSYALFEASQTLVIGYKGGQHSYDRITGVFGISMVEKEPLHADR
jgi:hypothetical protein